MSAATWRRYSAARGPSGAPAHFHPVWAAGVPMSQVCDKRVQFDFEIEFLNGGGLQGQGFRLDIPGGDIDERALADYIVRDLRLLRVGSVRIRNKTIIAEPHKRAEVKADPEPATGSGRLIDLSHTIEDGMITYKGLPAPLICDHLSR